MGQFYSFIDFNSPPRYIYTKEVVLLKSFNQALQLHYAAKKYMLLGLAKKCYDYLFDSLTTDKVWCALEFATLYDYPHLKVFND